MNNMSSPKTRKRIIDETKKLYAGYGYDGCSVRELVNNLSLAKSSIYNHFSSKDELLDKVFEEAKSTLGKKRNKLSPKNNLREDIEQIIRFQFKNSEDVVFILKYYLHFRDNFPKNSRGYLPVTSYRHIEEILERASERGEIDEGIDIPNYSQVIAHSINGFLLEYYPKKLIGSELEEKIRQITDFVVGGLNTTTKN